MSKTLKQAVEILTTENGSKPPRVKHPTYKTNISFFDGGWSMDFWYICDYDPK